MLQGGSDEFVGSSGIVVRSFPLSRGCCARPGVSQSQAGEGTESLIVESWNGLAEKEP